MIDGLVSIIMPVYNSEAFLKDSIESIKKQTYPNWEIIMVDDNSNDNSFDVMNNLTTDIKSKTKLIHFEQNRGTAIARNTALDLSEGEYIAYLDSDDIWMEDKLEKQIKFMKENNYAFTMTSFCYLHKDGSEKTIRNLPKSLTYTQAMRNTIIQTCTVMGDLKKIERKLFEMPDIKRGQDAATWWNILKNGNKIYGLNEPLSYYRVGNQSLSSNKLKAIKRTWNLYRNVEKFNFIKSSFYFSFYAINAVKKRIL